MNKLFLFVLLLTGLAVPGEAKADTEDIMHALTQGMPADVSDFIYRRVECNHWEGEEPYDAERAGEIEAATLRLGCEDLPQQEQSLREFYSGEPTVLESLYKATDLVF